MKWYEGSLALMVLLMLLIPNLLGIGILLFLIIWVIGIVQKKLQFKFFWMNGFLFLLYLGYVIGTIYTNHPDIASRYLEYKLSLVIFPMFFSFIPKKSFSFQAPVIAFVLGVSTLFFVGLIHSIPLYIKFSDFAFMQSSQFSFIHHPTYLSAFALFGMGLLWHGWKQNWRFFSKKAIVLFMVIMLLTQILSLSLSGMLLLMICSGVVILFLIKKKFGRKIYWATLIVTPFLLFALAKFTPGVNTQFKNSIDYLVEFFDDPDAFYKSKQTYVGGSETRLILWAASSRVVAEHPMGVGTGNLDEYLSDKLISIGQPHMAEKKYNPHNQFLQTAVELGLLGLAALLVIIVFGVFYSFRTKNYLLLLLVSSLAFNCLFESMLQRQSGIVFYVFWICLLIASKSYTAKMERNQ